MPFIKRVKDKIKLLPQRPGIYFFKNKKGEIIYVGKAANLRTRVTNYNIPSSQSNKTEKMVSETNDVEWQETDSGAEALIQESNAIKKLRPFYNIMMRDDKQYFYVTFSKDFFPRLTITHNPRKNNKLITSVGPFTNGKALRVTLKEIRKAIPFCTCRGYHKQPCLSSRLGLCPGYCCLIKTLSQPNKFSLQQGYLKNLRQIKKVLSGNISQVTQFLKSEMGKQAEQENFENAQKIKEKIDALNSVFQHKKIIDTNFSYPLFPLKNLEVFKKLIRQTQLPQRIEAYDVSNLKGNFATGSMVAFSLLRSNGATAFFPKKRDYRIFHLRVRQKGNDLLMLKELLQRRIKHLSQGRANYHWPAPQIIFIDGGKAQLNTAYQQLKKKHLLSSLSLFSLAKRQEKLYTVFYGSQGTEKRRTEKRLIYKTYYLDKLPRDIAVLFRALRNEAHHFAIRHHRLLRQKSVSIS